jgi:hypothetical protein
MDIFSCRGGGGERERRVYLGDGSADGGGGLPFSLAEVLLRFRCELLGALEMFWAGHLALQLSKRPRG